MTQKQLKRDNLLVDFLWQHKGKSNIVTTKEICDYLNANGCDQNIATLNMIVRRLVFSRHLPICSINSKGYYWGTTKQEILETVADLQGRIEEMQKRIELLKSFIIE